VVKDHGDFQAGRESTRNCTVAWWYRQYARHDETLAHPESEAREGKRDLWSDPHPIAPWEIRDPKNAPAISADLLDSEIAKQSDTRSVPIIGN
jgi:hypothetical protein